MTILISGVVGAVIGAVLTITIMALVQAASVYDKGRRGRE